MSYSAVVHASVDERLAGRVEQARRNREWSVAGSAFLAAVPGRLRVAYPELSEEQVEALVLPAWRLWSRGRLDRARWDRLMAGVLGGDRG